MILILNVLLNQNVANLYIYTKLFNKSNGNLDKMANKGIEVKIVVHDKNYIMYH